MSGNISFRDPIIKDDNKRFSYPLGEKSGGYTANNQPTQDPVDPTYRERSRKVAENTIAYMNKFADQVDGFRQQYLGKHGLEPEACAGHIRSTHAELKLLVRLMHQGDVTPPGATVFTAVSRHMCYNCRLIMAHLARNGNRKIFVATPRKSRKKKSATGAVIHQPEYVFFNKDGTFTAYSINGEHHDSLSRSPPLLWLLRVTTLTIMWHQWTHMSPWWRIHGYVGVSRLDSR